MLKKDIKISISTGILLGVLALALLLSGWIESHWALGLQVDTKDVLDSILVSHTKWRTIQGIAKTTWSVKNEGTQVYTTEFAFEQPGKALVKLIETPNLLDKTAWLSDGEFSYFINLETNTYVEDLLPTFATDLSMLPSNVNETTAGVIFLHPMTLLTPSPVAEFIFPHGFAQGKEGTVYKIIGEEEISGQETWIISMETSLDSVTAWIDKQSGIILRYVQETNGELFMEFEVLSINFDAEIAQGAFTPPK